MLECQSASADLIAGRIGGGGGRGGVEGGAVNFCARIEYTVISMVEIKRGGRFSVVFDRRL